MIRTLAVAASLTGLGLAAGFAPATTDTTVEPGTEKTAPSATGSTSPSDDVDDTDSPGDLPENPDVAPVIDAFTSRMIEAGFVDSGEPTDDSITDIDGGDDMDDADTTATTNPFDDCGLAIVEDSDYFPGTIANNESNELQYSEDSTGTTEMFSFDTPQSIGLVIGTLEAGETADADAIIESLTSEEGIQCINDTFAEQLANDPEMADVPPDAITFEASSPGPLDVGDVSGQLDITIGINYMIEIEMNASMMIARQGDYVALISDTSGGGADSGVDVAAEFETVIDDLAALG